MEMEMEMEREMDQSKAISNSRSSKKCHTCTHCKERRRFRTKGALADHQRDCHPLSQKEIGHTCTHCKEGRHSRTKGALAVHQRNFHPLSQKGSMSSVEIWHTCTHCKERRRFRTKGALSDHQRDCHPLSQKGSMSSVEIGHTCTHCKERCCFRTKGALVDHQRDCHPLSQKGSMSSVEIGSRYTCESCKACFSTMGALAEHCSRVHHPFWENESMSLAELGHVCPFCEMSFLSSKALDLHYSSSHHHPSVMATLSAVKTGQEDEDNENEEDGKEIWRTDRSAVICLRRYAEAALEHYNNQNVGKRYALVEHGPATVVEVMYHLNFKAKEEDCPSAPVETFFAQFTTQPHIRVDCCISLGPSNTLPHWRKAELGGCQFCHGIINHPTEWVANLRLKLSEF